MQKIFNTIHESWISTLIPIIRSDPQLLDFLEKVSSGEIPVYPKPENIFKAFSFNIKKLKVVIIGQDPYPKKGHAVGVAFGVDKDLNPLPYSLKAIFNEMERSYPINEPRDQTLNYLLNKGILLLNSGLTIAPGQPESHLDIWRNLTIRLLKTINNEYTPVFIVLGKKALGLFTGYPKSRIYESLKQAEMDEFDMQYKSQIVYAPHPAGDVYVNSNSKRSTFKNSGVFETVNYILKNKKQEQIKW